jgi:hypothetical protein
MCTVLLPSGDNPIAVNKYIIPYHKIIVLVFCIERYIKVFGKDRLYLDSLFGSRYYLESFISYPVTLSLSPAGSSIRKITDI